MPKMRWRPGLRPEPRWGAHNAAPDPLVGWGGGQPLPNPHPALGASILAPSALSFCAPQCKILATPQEGELASVPFIPYITPAASRMTCTNESVSKWDDETSAAAAAADWPGGAV